MDEKVKLQRVRMLSALGDFDLAHSAVVFLTEADEAARYSLAELRRFRCYEHTAIMAYARPFSQSKGKVPKLSLKQCGFRPSEPDKELHKTVINLRNTIVAHTDYEMMNFATFTYDSEAANNSSLLFTKHDEGLQFSSYLEQLRFLDLINAVQFSLYQKLINLAQDDPAEFNLSIHYPKSK